MGLKKFTIGADATELYPISVESKRIRRWRFKNKKKYMGTYSYLLSLVLDLSFIIEPEN